jgi:hypothetical protein
MMIFWSYDNKCDYKVVEVMKELWSFNDDHDKIV